MSDKGIFKHIEKSDLPKADLEELRELLYPLKTFRLGNRLWRVLPNGDWVEVR